MDITKLSNVNDLDSDEKKELKKTLNKAYVKIDDVPKYKHRASMKECALKKGINYWGVNKADDKMIELQLNIMKDDKMKKSKKMTKEKLEKEIDDLKMKWILEKGKISKTEKEKDKIDFVKVGHEPIKKKEKEIEVLKENLKKIGDELKEKKELFKNWKEPTKKGKGIFDNIKKFVTEPFRTIKGRLIKNSQAVLDKYANDKIFKIYVFRKALNSILQSAIKVISLGTFNPEKEGYDKLYHLGLWIQLENGHNIIMEKNDSVSIYEGGLPSDVESKIVPMHNNLTLKEFYDNGLKKMGDDRFFQYSGLKYNCQDFVKGLLESNNMYNSDINNFVFQDMENIKKQLHPTTEKIMNTITDTANIARKWMGQGICARDIGSGLGHHINEHHSHLSNDEKIKLFNDVIKLLKK